MGLVELSEDYKKYYRPLTEAEADRCARIQKIYNEGPHNQKDIERLTGIDQSQFSKMIRCKIPFSQNHVAKIAQLYHYDFRELWFGKREVPICAIISAMEGFPYLLSVKTEGDLGMVALPEELPSGTEGIYCLRMGPEFQPLFPDSTLIFVERGAGDAITEGNWGIFIDDLGKGHLRRVVYLSDGMNILLESIVPGLIKPISKPKSYLRSMDKVRYLKFS